ncbi:MAG TPA: histidine kinase [Rhizomicrobium sp.]|jgi:LytS/YehU family sensor histidine kinase|nr:histidine kinase [Rhizomicrobium sp.]
MLAGAAILLLLSTLGLAWLAIWQHRRFARRIAETELRRLRAQVDPHFLFNTLNAISELGYDDPESADHAITTLSGLLRTSLDETRQQEISLQDELEFLGDYLSLQRLLMRDDLAASVSTDPRAAHARVPAMILQPLVENALTHGRPIGGKGRIRVSTSRNGETLLIEVHDNGPGFNSGASGAVRKGIGIANTRARLDYLYGGKAVLELKDGDEGGAVARLTLPFREAP